MNTLLTAATRTTLALAALLLATAATPARAAAAPAPAFETSVVELRAPQGDRPGALALAFAPAQPATTTNLQVVLALPNPRQPAQTVYYRFSPAELGLVPQDGVYTVTIPTRALPAQPAPELRATVFGLVGGQAAATTLEYDLALRKMIQTAEERAGAALERLSPPEGARVIAGMPGQAPAGTREQALQGGAGAALQAQVQVDPPQAGAAGREQSGSTRTLKVTIRNVGRSTLPVRVGYYDKNGRFKYSSVKNLKGGASYRWTITARVGTRVCCEKRDWWYDVWTGDLWYGWGDFDYFYA